MAKVVYTGVSNKARKCKALYVGVSNKARKITKGYVGVSNKARLFYSSEYTWAKYNVTTVKSYSKSQLWSDWARGYSNSDYYYPMTIDGVNSTCGDQFNNRYGGRTDLWDMMSDGAVNMFSVSSYDEPSGRISYYVVHGWNQYSAPDISTVPYCMGVANGSSGTSSTRHVIMYKINSTNVQQIGSFIGYVTSTNSSAYPDNGVSGSYWYIKQ